MNRREWLKILAGGTAGLSGLALTGFPFDRWTRPPVSCSFYAVTNRPQSIVRDILSATRESAERYAVRARPIAPTRQDVTLIRNGVLVDPTRETNEVHLHGLARELRSQRRPGTHLVAIEPAIGNDVADVVFETNGRIVERVPRRRDYNRIVIPGDRGDTVFSLHEGQLSVVKASCRHELCKRCGGVRSGRIICAPNHLIASIGGLPAIYDTITG